MKYILKHIQILLACFSLNVYSQNSLEIIQYPDTLFTTNDSFFVKGLVWEKEWILATTTSDTVDLGTDGFEGNNIMVWTQRDTITIPYVNAPFEQKVLIPIASKNDTTIYKLRFNAQSSKFSNSLISDSRGKIVFQIPEIYELANIILFLSDCSVLTKNHFENSEYSKNVLNYFGKFKNHPLIQILNKKCLNGNHWSVYYGFRENSICYKFEENNLIEYATQYKHVYSDNTYIQGGEFRNLVYLVQDFINQTDYRSFFKSNSKYYKQLETRQNELQPIQNMWNWLEKEFPQKLDCYKIFFSPLIEGSHSTQKFYKGFFKKPEYQECIMFINSPEKIDANVEYSEVVKKGLMSGIVFTEIDHNYVNPTSSENFNAIKSLISNKDIWATIEAQENYRSEYSIFNEYMTHSLFCLYVTETYSEHDRIKIVNQRIKLMERRGFIKFDQFNEKLINKLKGRKMSVYEMYPEIIEIMKEIK